jgi:hypothetical protein
MAQAVSKSTGSSGDLNRFISIKSATTLKGFRLSAMAKSLTAIESSR